MIVIKKIISLMLVAILLYSCGYDRYRLVSDYEVCLSSSGQSWEFGSKLGCSENPKAFNVRSVQWNNHIIIIANENESKKIEYFIVYSQDQELQSCYIENVNLGPLTIDEVNTFKVKYKIGALKENSFSIRNN